MKTLLFAPETFNIAETTRMIEIAKACGSDFHCAFMGYGGEYEGLIHEAGFDFYPMQPTLSAARIEELWKADRMERGGKFFTTEELSARVRGELALYAQLKPVALVIGFTLSTLISARVGGVPLVVVTPFPLTRPFFDANPTLWGELLRGTPIGWLPDKLVNGVINAWGKRTRIWTKTMNETAVAFGGRPFERMIDMFMGDHTLITDVSLLTGVTVLPANCQYVGPIFARLSGEVPPEIMNLPRDKPLVYFAMGSSANREVLQQVLGWFDGLPVQVVAPIKRHLAGTGTAVPGNVQVFDWLPAHKVNPLVDTAVIHGGQGTTQTACAAGIPFLGIGMQPEQDINILLVAHYGSALHLNRYALKRDNFVTALNRLLQEPTFRQKAHTLRDELTHWDGATQTANFLRQQF